MSFTPRTSYGNFGSSQYMQYALARTGVAMPNCFTYATARISEIVGHNQPLDRYKVSGASQLWNAYAPEYTRSSIPVLGALAIFSGGVAPYYYGHVAVVEGISDGKITISESSYKEFNFRLNKMYQAPGSYYPNGYNNLRLCGYLIHKELGGIKLTNENGTYTLTAPTNKRRDSPVGLIAETLPTGKKLTYTNVTTFNNMRYISWVEKEPNGNQYRYFVYAPLAQATSGYNEGQLINEIGVATLTQRVNKRRDTPTGMVVETLPVGKKLPYTNKWIGNGHRYISWVETEPNGNKYRYFVAVSGSEKYGVDRWATFGTEEVKKEVQTPTTKSEIDESNVKHWGVDLSEHNIDSVDLSVYDFAIIRACYGENTDKKLGQWIERLNGLKKPYGLYVYDYAISDDEAKAEAQYTINIAKKYKPELGVWLDMEDADGYKKKRNAWTKERAVQTCKIVCKAIQDAGFFTGIYSSTWFFTNWLNDSELNQYDKWVAQWDKNDGLYHSDTSSTGSIHQYTSIDSHSGLALDKNAMYVEFDHYKAKSDEQKQPEEPKKDDSKPNTSTDDNKPKSDDKEPNKKDDSNKEIDSWIVKLIKAIIKFLNKKASDK